MGLKKFAAGLSRFSLLAGGLVCSLASNTSPCDPEPDITVALAVASEDVRSLPVIASGKTHLLTADVPDSHGDVKVKLLVQNAKAAVSLSSIEYAQTIAGAAKDIEFTARRKGTADYTGGPANDADVLQFQWRTKALTDLALPVGAAHSARVTARWEFKGCRIQSGTASVDVPGLVKAAASATNLKLLTAEAYQPNPTKGAKVKLQLRSNVADAVDGLRDLKYSVSYFGSGAVPTLGIGLLTPTNIALQANGQGVTGISAVDTLDVYSSPTPNQPSAPYDFAGQAASTGVLGAGKGLIMFSITSYKASAPTVSVTDTFAELVDLKAP
jgi:hypothetical protein